jgi:hypothetical protein
VEKVELPKRLPAALGNPVGFDIRRQRRLVPIARKQMHFMGTRLKKVCALQDDPFNAAATIARGKSQSDPHWLTRRAK